jgi:ATP-dependent helicase/nuclease subunit B
MAIATLDSDLPMPVSMSPSAYKALRDCPYRYYVRSLLGLRKLKGFEEGFDASLAGQTLHKILRNFYHAMKSEKQKSLSTIVTDAKLRSAWMQDQLTLISEQVFKRLIEGDARVLGVLRDWQKQIPSFVEWQLERESRGWQFHDAELKVGFEFTFTDAHHQEHMVRIEGYTDRLDVHAANRQAAILDYKHQSPDKIKKRADQLMDDPQLLLYTKAISEEHRGTEHPVVEAEWVALKMNLKKKESSARSLMVDSLAGQVMALDKQARYQAVKFLTTE